jgi:hypothetical protein
VEITRVSSRFRVCVDSKGVTPSGDGQRIDFTSVTGELAGWRVSGLAKDRLVKGRLAKVRLVKSRLVKNRSAKGRLAEGRLAKNRFVKSRSVKNRLAKNRFVENWQREAGASWRLAFGVPRWKKHVAGNGKGRSLERPFLFLTLYYQNTKRSVETCQISLGILACKWRVMTACYFGAEAGLLTKKEEKAKGAKSGITD